VSANSGPQNFFVNHLQGSIWVAMIELMFVTEEGQDRAGELDTAAAVLRGCTEALDVAGLTATDAAALVAKATEVERLAAGARVLLSAKAAEAGTWRAKGHRSPEDWLAQQAGTSVGQAKGDLETSKKLSQCPKTEQAVREGKVSPAQAREITDAAAADPSAEGDLLGLAEKGAAHKELRDESRRRKAAADPDPDATARRIHRERRIRTGTDPDGTWWLNARGPTAAGAGRHGRPASPGRPDLPRQPARRDPRAPRGLPLRRPRPAPHRHHPDRTSTRGLTPRRPGVPRPLALQHPHRQTVRLRAARPPPPVRRALPGRRPVIRPPLLLLRLPAPAPGASHPPQAGAPSPSTSAPHPADPAATDPGASPAPHSPAHTAHGTPDPPGTCQTQQAASGPPGGSPAAGPRSPDSHGPSDPGPPPPSPSPGPAETGHSVPTGPPAPSPSPGSPGTGPPAPTLPGLDVAPPPVPRAVLPSGANAKIIVRIDHTALVRGYPVTGEVCEVDGIGTVDVASVRDWMTDAFVAAVLTDGTDITKVVHLGRKATALQTTALQAQGIRCARLGCGRTEGLQIDHREDWSRTKHTRLDELDWLCRYEHSLKTLYGWTLEPGTGPRPMHPPDERPGHTAA
jgi:hypothetical protein